MKKYKGRLVGILGTVIIHLIAAIIFMSFQLKSIRRDLRTEFTIEFIQVAESEEEDKRLIELPASSIEKILQGDEELLNIARNLANQPDIEIDPEEYVNKVKEELIEKGLLNPESLIDEQNMEDDTDPEGKLSFQKEVENKPKESQELAANYQGPTRIYYELEGRNHTYLPIPIYKCPGSGIVTLSIRVNQKGIVEAASIIGTEKTTDPCLAETAVSSALVSRFNSDINAPKIQTGTLTYHFVAQ
ncbi:MAG TPA: hypothetical protein PLI41_08540 [Bacteroidales bacterium]|jgi:hypothetical protein|nr:hypothetical protein [Bacteroidales bacterium]HPY67930.1 hypothetical protein [Bacteroidales bacterium]HQB37575.1 hypothetical protein [Bacteroidales bacterium]